MLDKSQENSEDEINEKTEVNNISPEDNTSTKSVKNDTVSSTDDAVEDSDAIEENEEETENEDDRNSIPELDYENMEQEDLADELERLLKEHPVQKLKTRIDTLKNAFDSKFSAFLAEKKAAFLEEGGESIDFQFTSPTKTKYNSLLSQYKNKRDAYYLELNSQLKGNLEKRHNVINELKELIEVADANTMYKSFKALQSRWREIGQVPRNKYNDTWRNYHHHTERFYDLLHLSNDFRDLDFKYNLEEKLKLIEKVEALTKLENINEAFKELQQYHKAWKEDIGPVSKEHREDVWQKFSEASKSVHDKRDSYFKSLKSQSQDIIQKKLVIISEIENYNTSKNKKHTDWQKSIKDIETLRKKYFDAGKLPYLQSEEIWKKFKNATKKFNHAKNDFYKNEKNIQQTNLDKKNALIALAESYKDSEDWEIASNAMKKIQADWKKIGHVPRKFSDGIWKQFKTACNSFFDRYNNKQEDLNKEQQLFIEEKKAYLDKFRKVEAATLDEINETISKWRDFGETPRSVRHIETKFYKHIDKLLEGLSLDKEEIAMLKYKNLIDGYLAENNSQKLISEQLFVKKKVDELTKEIQQLENNLSFFSNAKDDNPLLINVRADIESFKEDIKVWEQKMNYIKSLDF